MLEVPTIKISIIMTREQEIYSVSNKLSELFKCSKTFKNGI